MSTEHTIPASWARAEAYHAATRVHEKAEQKESAPLVRMERNAIAFAACTSFYWPDRLASAVPAEFAVTLGVGWVAFSAALASDFEELLAGA